MSNREDGSNVARLNERKYPHIVEVALPDRGFLSIIEAIERFHRLRAIEARRGRSTAHHGAYWGRWCFNNSRTAEAFCAEFSGEMVRNALAREESDSPFTDRTILDGASP
jgi:hypothetical protein